MSGGWQALRETDRDLALSLLFAPAASRDPVSYTHLTLPTICSV